MERQAVKTTQTDKGGISPNGVVDKYTEMSKLLILLPLLLLGNASGLRRGRGYKIGMFDIRLVNEVSLDSARRRLESVEEPPPHQQAARMARYVVHNSGQS